MTDLITECPSRVLVIGPTGAGKTTLCSKVFNVVAKNGGTVRISKKSEDINPHARGTAATQVWNEITFNETEGFNEAKEIILHDSGGFEVGHDGSLDEVKSFIKNRQGRTTLAEQLHCIWYCISLAQPRAFEQRFFTEVDVGEIPVVVVFTHFDFLEDYYHLSLVKQHHRNHPAIAHTLAVKDYDEIYKPELEKLIGRRTKVAFCRVAIPPDDPTREQGIDDLIQTTIKLLTKDGALLRLWAVAQQQNAKMKREKSIEIAIDHVSALSISNSLPLTSFLASKNFMSSFNNILTLVSATWGLIDKEQELQRPFTQKIFFKACLNLSNAGRFGIATSLAFIFGPITAPFMTIAWLKVAVGLIVMHEDLFWKQQADKGLRLSVELVKQIVFEFSKGIGRRIAAAYVDSNIGHSTYSKTTHCKEVLTTAVRLARGEESWQRTEESKDAGIISDASSEAEYVSKPTSWTSLSEEAADVELAQPSSSPVRSIVETYQTDGRRGHVVEQSTDSAYASETLGNPENTSVSTDTVLEVIIESTQDLLEDSAFAGSELLAQRQDKQVYGLYTEQTIYSASETSTLPPRDESYIVDLAAGLFAAIKPIEAKRETLENIFEILPSCLRAFALKIGHKAPSQMHRDISFFVHKYRRLIQASFEAMFQLEDINCDVESSNIDREQLRKSAIDRFLREEMEASFEMDQQAAEDIDEAIDPMPTSLESEENKELLEDDTKLLPDPGIYRDFVVKQPAYSWLVASLQREATLKRATPDLMENISKGILSVLPSYRKVSRKEPSQEYRAIFELSWNPLPFIKEQQYTESPHEALMRAITLTGSANDAQAVTTGEYLSQTWPATGKYVMQLITDVVCNTVDHLAKCNLPDGTELEARIIGSKFIVTTAGTGDSIAETGQQFAWLGASLRSSPFETGVAICSPVVRSTLLDDTASSTPSSGRMYSAEILCKIGFEMKKPSTNRENVPGQCWHNMFRNPVMVNGYPILNKQEAGLGLEMPLNIIAGLTGSERANEFDGKIFIKGFSTMLIATRLARDLLVWHYFYNCNGERISYLDHMLQDVENISLLQLDTARHVVGWCSDCKYFAGAADAQYNIDETDLPRPHAGCLLEKVSISGGKIITGGVTFAVSVKDIPPHLTRNGYIPKLKWIATKYVVLWDEADKRGWLVNGTSALLHLVRTSLRHYSEDDFSTSFLFDPSKMQNAADHKPNSAPKVLINDKNKEMVIYPGRSEMFEEDEAKETVAGTEESTTRMKKRGYYLFEDLVEQHYHNLEQIIDHHQNVVGQNGMKIKTRMRKYLEGWDFFELATDHDPHPRVATLNALGYGWVDFIRSIDAITLFGRGFGEIIQPIEFDGICPNWRSLPKDQYYLAASVFDLNNIMKKFGDKRANPLRLVHDLLWHSPGQVVSPCRCQAHSSSARHLIRKALSTQHHDPVQILCPQRSHLILNIRGPEKLEESGAVVFGHSINWKYRWRENGYEGLEEGEPLLGLSAHEQQIISDTNLGSPDRESSLLTTSGSSQSRGSISPSGYSTQSTPVESIGDTGLVQDLKSAQPNP